MAQQDLVSRARLGEQDAFEQLVIENQNRIYTLCLRMTGNPQDAQDLAQEAFLKAWRGLGSFQGDSSFSTWVYRLASNVCIDFLRREKRRQGISPAFSLDDEDRADLHPPDYSQDPAAAYQRDQQRQELERALEQLPAHHRQVLVMRELSGLSYQEISQSLGIDLGTVKSRLARARLAMKKILQDGGNFF